MNSDLRRSQRYNGFLTVSVVSRNTITGNKGVGPFSGRIINISHHGVCLLMALGKAETYELYRSTCNNDQMCLEIHTDPSHDDQQVIFTGRPVWLDPFIIDDLRAFKMGVEFNAKSFFHSPKNFIQESTTTSTDDFSLQQGIK